MKNLEDDIKKAGKIKNYQKDEFLFSPQDRADGFYYVESGEIRVFKMDDQGREVEVVRLESGDFLGEAIVFVSESFPSYAQAVKDSELLFFEKQTVLDNLERNPKIAEFFIHLLAKKCVILNKRIEALELRTVRQRLIQYLLSHCLGERECLVELKTKKVELAKILGTISETLSRNLKQMQEEDLIEVQGNKIHIKSCPKMREELQSQL